MARDSTAIQIDGVPYRTANQVAETCGVSRQTLWRWRNSGVVPQGQLYRGRIVVYTAEEQEVVRRYANRLQRLEIAGNRPAAP